MTNDIGLAALIRADFAGFMALDATSARSMLRRRIDVLALAGFWAVVIYRISAWLYARGLAPLARLLMTVDVILFGCEISPRTKAGPGLVIPHPQLIAIGAGVVLGDRVKLLRGVGMGTAGYRDKTRDGWPEIGDDCVVCDGAKVFGPVRVGARSTIGTSVVLFESVPDDTIVSLRQDLDIRSSAPHVCTAEAKRG